MTIIKIDKLFKKYPDPAKKNTFFNAVDGISLSINEGEIYGFLGPNGAGKTTTLEMLEGQMVAKPLLTASASTENQ
jgi:ABC-2 type transport system ATP-binding protein